MGWLTNVKGRKLCLITGGLMTSISYLILVFAKSLATVYISRVLCGFAIASVTVTNLVYIGEIALVYLYLLYTKKNKIFIISYSN